MTAFYRKLWIKHYGPIPVDEFGVSYEIHHIDGNRDNNELTNLQCVSIAEHFKIHFEQGDYQAALLISEKIKDIEHLRQIGHTPKTLAAYMVEHELGLWSPDAKEKAKQTKRERRSGACFNKAIQSSAGKIGGPRGAKVTIEIHRKNGTGFFSSENQSKFSKIAWATNPPVLLGIPKAKVTCPHCGKVGGGQALMNRWHFDNCKKLTDPSYIPPIGRHNFSDEPYVRGESASDRIARLKKKANQPAAYKADEDC